jgi:hypothetical protein
VTSQLLTSQREKTKLKHYQILEDSKSVLLLQLLETLSKRELVLEVTLPLYSDQKKRLRLPNQKQVLLIEDLSHHLSSAASMIEEIFQSLSITVLRTSSPGKLISCPSIIITTSLFSSKASVRNKSHTDSCPFREPSTCSIRVVPRYYQSSLSSSFPSKLL